MRRKKDESLSQFEVAIESGEFQLPEELGLPRLSFKQIIDLYLDLWSLFTQLGRQDPVPWLWVLRPYGYKVKPAVAELKGIISESALRQRLSRLRKALKLIRHRPPHQPH